MANRHKILWSRSARSDLLAIVGYIAEDNMAAAERILSRIQTATGELEQLPEQGRLVPELRLVGDGRYRELIVLHWRVVYRLEAGVVYVLLVMDARRNVEDILLERLSRPYPPESAS